MRHTVAVPTWKVMTVSYLRISLTRVLMTLTLIAGVMFGVATPANAVSCYGDYCSGKDPQASGCSAGAFTTQSWGNNIFMLEVRWSPNCQTNWTRITMYDTGLIGCTPAGTLKAVQETGYTQSASIDAPCSTPTFTRWTPMIYSPVYAVQGQFSTHNTTYYTPWS